MSNIPDWVGAATGLLAIILSVYASWAARRSDLETRRLQKKNAELAARQTRLTERAWTDGYFREVTNWGTATSLAIARAIHVAPEATPEEADVRSLLSEISAAIDTGRWYFPNQFHEEAGREKEPAYRGVRRPILTELVGAYQALSQLRGHERYAELVRRQRRFVSAMQSVLDPRDREQVISRVLHEFRDAERSKALGDPAQE